MLNSIFGVDFILLISFKIRNIDRRTVYKYVQVAFNEEELDTRVVCSGLFIRIRPGSSLPTTRPGQRKFGSLRLNVPLVNPAAVISKTSGTIIGN